MLFDFYLRCNQFIISHIPALTLVGKEISGVLQLRQSYLKLTFVLGVPVIKYRTEEHNQIRLISRLRSTSPNRMTGGITANSISWIAKVQHCMNSSGEKIEKKG